MNYFILLFTSLLSLSINGQSTEEKLKTRILTLEAKDSVRYNQKVSNIHFVSFNYSLIPLKNWWKSLYDAHHKFSDAISELNKQLQSQDSISRNPNMKPVPADKQPASSFDGEAYFKDKYEKADPSQKIYEVIYQIEYKLGNSVVKSGPIRRAFFPKDLSEVRSFN